MHGQKNIKIPQYSNISRDQRTNFLISLFKMLQKLRRCTKICERIQRRKLHKIIPRRPTYNTQNHRINELRPLTTTDEGLNLITVFIHAF